MTRYIFVAGGVMSGIGKGVTTASIARILKSRGFRVTAAKIDPYVNVDAGTMNPIEHGETFVTDDGMECDQDVGNYERFLGEDIPRENYMTTGAVYQEVIRKERNLEYGGACVQVVPAIPQEVIERLETASKKAQADFTLVEIGGTVGEYENILFLEAARMMRLARPKNVLFVLVSYLPVPSMIGEMKTKPTQHAVRAMNATGLQPDFIIARSTVSIDEPRKKKLAVFCNVHEEDVISAPDVTSIYEIPLNFEKDMLGDRVLEKFGMKRSVSDMADWKDLVTRIKGAKRQMGIAIVGKYFQTGDFVLADSYISVIEAIKHAAWAERITPEIVWLNAEEYENDPQKLQELDAYDGIIVPGGFGPRGVEGKILAIQYARERQIPYFGLCYGMQLATIEFARNVCGLKGANTTEVDPQTAHPVITPMEEQQSLIQEKHFGGSMRLGAYDCRLTPGSLSMRAYAKDKSGTQKNGVISERHRHRYEFNNAYRETLTRKGLVVAGCNPQRNLVEIIELADHPFFVGTQFHPEFKSRPLSPHPLYRAFIQAALDTKNKNASNNGVTDDGG
ncbi:MAG: CTP synthase [Candidatus Sungbacteria bacterium RIFCSPLOWO2_02_FULL_54_10]|uniref:CTP synthase n=2 Tax=Candidatus Sungiibacteriota TaxID=1817917 RepID=A0A1G2L6S6_9BACT|nr:MAG: CTP synthase [Candidatus Sungbacteria bacterium RIFCSPHIGHO2_01_FULL_54_26]OHA02578.1 MAG: CTP synthase [Candidatus Sungbacteria bacterium RIFCSPHIGHO2_02_FULL_53_17]OHA07377.1 MAG: CTP synthase [Candidatus Sungbacteria bacterium RIFCSPLOWO2_01_FULL_54_21]OHA12716.1 MAG: CTP synthase [Candidatus Sungbacteria bacterium RIFCSPLOWO2_02_FULL_54_10]